MADDAIKLGGQKKSRIVDKVMEILFEGGNLNLLLKILHLVGADWTYGSKGWGEKITVCFWPTMRPGSISFAPPPITRMTWVATFFSTTQ